MRFSCLILILLLIAPSVLAQTGSIKLLALVEKGSNVTGGVADLSLEIQPGRERVFLETFPLTKVSTQISMRFAQQIACNELDLSCADKDFFYTIHAISGIVGGPSAGGAATVLTAALLKNLPLKENMAMTGTINSGGIIGPVGGVKEKVEAAARSGIKTVLVPKGSKVKEDSQIKDSKSNETIVQYGASLGITVIEITTLAEALEYFTDYQIPGPDGTLQINEQYQHTMQDVAKRLCSRTSDLTVNVENLSNKTQQNVNEFLNRSNQASSNSSYYSAASYCFRANVILQQEAGRNATPQDTLISARTLQNSIAEFTGKIDARELETINDLQTYMMVKERLIEAEKTLQQALSENTTAERAQGIAYGQERFESATTWAAFFNTPSPEFKVNPAKLKRACEAKIAEADERYNYVISYIPQALGDTQKSIDEAIALLQGGQYAICLHQASKAKAESDAILNLLGVDEKDVDQVLQRKLQTVTRALLKAQRKDIFPLIGYSYYEYANSLKANDKVTALLFAEYALELSNIDIYFDQKAESTPINNPSVWTAFDALLPVLTMFLGFIGGACLILAIVAIRQRKHNPEQSHSISTKQNELTPLSATKMNLAQGYSQISLPRQKTSRSSLTTGEQTRARPRKALRGKKR